MNSHKDGQAILSIGLAIRIAQSIGLHRSLAAHKHPYEKEFVRKEHHLRNCVWWTCYCLDKYAILLVLEKSVTVSVALNVLRKLCFDGGRPSGIFDDDCDADIPDFEDIDAKSPASLRTNENVRPSSFFRSLIGLCKILSSITSKLFSRYITSQSETAIISHIIAVDDKLLTWKNTLPFELQPEQELTGVKDGINYVGAALLHCAYHNAMLVVHRASLLSDKITLMRSHDNPRIAASDAICLNAARSLAKSVNDWISTKSELLIDR
jgi:hypothetical protein